MPKLSIIVPVYRAEAYLTQCLDSIRAQAFTDYECILVDDGSPDACGKICDGYQALDGRFLVIHKENGGVVSARNAGIALALGRYVGFVDADDVVLPHHFLSLMDAAERADADMVLAGYRMEAADGTQSVCPEGMPDGVYTGAAMKTAFFPRFFPNGTNGDTAMIPSLCSALFRKTIVAACCVRIPESVRYGEDWALKTLCVLRAGTVVVLKNACGYVYRQHVASAVHAYQKDLLENNRLLEALLMPEVSGAADGLRESFQVFVLNHCLSIVLNECTVEKTTTMRESFAIISEALDDPVMGKAARSTRLPAALLRDRVLLFGIYHGWKCYLCCCCCALQAGRRIKRALVGK